ncbi:MAG: hypothetical protein OXJ90_16590 [Spirochaetaceae bacterium]|nr:hypothetical protein [Spirochaetaceae bacterium]
MRLKTLLIGIGTLVVAAAVAVVFVTSATAATVPEPPAVEAQSSKDYGLGENCPLSGHGNTI